MPRALRWQGLLKSSGLRPDTTPDERATWAVRHTSLPVSLTVPSLYPRLFPVHSLPPAPADGTAPELPSTTCVTAPHPTSIDLRGMVLWAPCWSYAQ